jgi:hypothetical protein
MIAQTGLGCGIGNSPRVDVAWLGFICSAVTKLGLKGMIPVTLKAARVVDSLNTSRYTGAHTMRNSAFDTSRITFDSKSTMARCQHVFILAKQTTSRPWRVCVQCGRYPSKIILFLRAYSRNSSE